MHALTHSQTHTHSNTLTHTKRHTHSYTATLLSLSYTQSLCAGHTFEQLAARWCVLMALCPPVYTLLSLPTPLHPSLVLSDNQPTCHPMVISPSIAKARHSLFSSRPIVYRPVASCLCSPTMATASPPTPPPHHGPSVEGSAMCPSARSPVATATVSTSAAGPRRLAFVRQDSVLVPSSLTLGVARNKGRSVGGHCTPLTRQ